MSAGKLKRPAMLGAGRPREPNARRYLMRFLVTEAEAARFLEGAEQQALTFSDWARGACERRLEEER